MATPIPAFDPFESTPPHPALVVVTRPALVMIDVGTTLFWIVEDVVPQGWVAGRRKAVSLTTTDTAIGVDVLRKV